MVRAGQLLNAEMCPGLFKTVGTDHAASALGASLGGRQLFVHLSAWTSILLHRLDCAMEIASPKCSASLSSQSRDPDLFCLPAIQYF